MHTCTKILSLLICLLALTSCGKSAFLNDGKSGSSIQSLTPALTQDGGLRFDQSQIGIDFQWTVGPLVTDESKMRIELSDKLNPYDLTLYLWMPGMGHGSFPVAVTKIAPGIFEVSEIYFIMDGYWDIHFQLIENGKILEEKLAGLTL